ncbi:MAG: M20/M25/M40 family metallo-hydrolase [Sphingomonadales bacterium]|jgi:Zn-dependent M28 family amino/carboxypeptidase
MYVRSLGSIVGLFLLSAFGAAHDSASLTPNIPSISAENVKAHITVLADDALMGRDADSEGFDKAADYVKMQMKALGLKPGAGDGYFQPVTLRSHNASADGAEMILHGAGGDEALEFKTEFIPGSSSSLEQSEIRAPLVFAGYGIDAPEIGHDDFEGLDVEGKIILILSGAPAQFQSEERAYYSSSKAEMAEAHGAIGIITFLSKASEKHFSFERLGKSFGRKRMVWTHADGRSKNDDSGIKATAAVSSAVVTKLFETVSKSFEDIRTEAETSMPKGFALPYEVTLKTKSVHERAESENVIGILEGSDPVLRNEFVVLSAHLDHVGIGHAVDGDEIYNGALDNAAGISTMLEVARAFKNAEEKPKRSIIFLAVTAEEKGLVGSDYFAHNPTVEKSSIVADVNLDMPLILYDFADVIAFGADRSSLGPLVKSAAAQLNVGLSPDPLPDLSLFVRSDHYRFVQQGVPSVFLVTGFNAVGEDGKGGEIFKNFLNTHYHKPSDDLNLPIDFKAGAKFAKINYLIARNIANASERPHWNEGDFFGSKYAK